MSSFLAAIDLRLKWMRRIMTERAASSSGIEVPSDSSNDLRKKVIEWLDRQGYPLEMYTARCCRDAGLSAYQSWYYFDEESEQQRETDVFGHTKRIAVTRKKRDFELSFTFECKQSRARPWVAFVHGNQDVSMSPRGAMAQRIVPKYTSAWWEDLTQKAGKHNTYPLESTSPTAYSLTRVSFDRSNEDAAYAALMSVAKAALGITYWLDLAAKGDREHKIYFAVVIPVLVLDAPLFSCCLNNENDEVSVNSINRCMLQWGNQISPWQPPTTIIEIVTKQSLPAFLHDMNTALTRIAGLALKSR
jgi:hypothetical protein